MKAEDAKRLWCLATSKGGSALAPTPEQLEKLTKFARACEQHGIERAKQFMVPVAERFGGFNWSALDAEIAKENEDG